MAVAGYRVDVDARFTGEWPGETREQFMTLLGITAQPPGADRAALLMDPDTGIGANRGPSHVTFQEVVDACDRYALVVVFDQSFNRGVPRPDEVRRKLAVFAQLGCAAMYYDSHASFLFASRDTAALANLRSRLVACGLPESRLIAS